MDRNLRTCGGGGPTVGVGLVIVEGPARSSFATHGVHTPKTFETPTVASQSRDGSLHCVGTTHHCDPWPNQPVGIEHPYEAHDLRHDCRTSFLVTFDQCFSIDGDGHLVSHDDPALCLVVVSRCRRPRRATDRSCGALPQGGECPNTGRPDFLSAGWSDFVSDRNLRTGGGGGLTGFGGGW